MDSGSVGIKEIDDQHAAILAALGRVRESARDVADWCARHEEILQLRELCAMHFRVEESLMRLHRFPGHEAHADEHRRFERQLSELAVRAVTLPIETHVVDALASWWDVHIRESDKAYAVWFAGASPAGLLTNLPEPNGRVPTPVAA